MKQVTLLSFFLAFFLYSSFLAAQCSMSEYRRIMQLAQEDLDVRNYQRAINRFLDARDICPLKKKEVDQWISTAFQKIEEEKTKAETAQRLAETAQAETELQRKIADSLRLNAEAKGMLSQARSLQQEHTLRALEMAYAAYQHTTEPLPEAAQLLKQVWLTHPVRAVLPYRHLSIRQDTTGPLPQFSLQLGEQNIPLQQLLIENDQSRISFEHGGYLLEEGDGFFRSNVYLQLDSLEAYGSRHKWKTPAFSYWPGMTHLTARKEIGPNADQSAFERRPLDPLLYEGDTLEIVKKRSGGRRAANRQYGYNWNFAFSPDQQFWAYAEYGRVGLYDWQADSPRFFDKTSPDFITDMVITPDNRHLIASAIPDLEMLEKSDPIKVWDLSSGQRLPRLQGQTNAVLNLALSEDGRRLFVAEEIGEGKIWDLGQDRLIRQFRSPDPTLYSSFSTDDRYLFTWGTQQAHLWDLSAYPAPVVFPQLNRKISSAALGTTQLWVQIFDPIDDLGSTWQSFDLQTGLQNRNENKTRGSTLLSMSRDERYALMGNPPYYEYPNKDYEDFAGLALVDLRNNEMLLGWGVEFEADAGYCFSADNRWLAVQPSRWDSLLVYDVQTQQKGLYPVLGNKATMVPAFCFGPQNDGLWVADSTGEVHQIDLLTGKRQRSLTLSTQQITALTFSPDGQSFACIDKAGQIVVQNLRSGVQRAAWTVPEISTVRKLLFSPDGHYLILYDRLGTIQVWSLRSGKQIERYAGLVHTTPIPFLEMLPNENHLYFIDQAGTLREEPCCVEVEEVLDWMEMLKSLE